MKLFLDTSTLIKLYYKEEGTSELDKIFATYSVTEIFLSEISKVEFFSAIYKKVRTKNLTFKNAHDILKAFIADEGKYKFISINSEIVSSSQKLIEKYGINGLRSLDAMQLAPVCGVQEIVDVALSSDNLLNSFLVSENIRISIAGV